MACLRWPPIVGQFRGYAKWTPILCPRRFPFTRSDERATAPLFVSDRWGRWNVATVSPWKNRTRAPRPSSIRHPAANSNASMSLHFMLPLVGVAKTARRVLRCFPFMTT